MKIKKGFKLRTIGGEYIVAGEGLEQINFNKLISLNETAAYLWKEVQEIDFDEKLCADLLMQEYGVDENTAFSDSKSLIEQWQTAGLIEE